MHLPIPLSSLLRPALIGAVMLSCHLPLRAEIVPAEKRMASGLQNAAATAYYPARKEFWLRFNFDRKTVRFREVVELGAALKEVKVDLREKTTGKSVAAKTLVFPRDADQDIAMATPELEGDYEVRIDFLTGENTGYRITQDLQRRKFAWEGNTLGISEAVPRPFTEVSVKGREVGVVLRTYRMNDFGLMDQIVADGRELLAAPMALRYELADGKAGEWTSHTVKAGAHTPGAALFAAQAEAPAVAVETGTRVEYDGVARVDLTLKPGPQPAPIRRLWLEIPLRSAETPLMHTYVDRNRVNPAGYVPKGDGVVWTSAEAQRGRAWRNTFCAYIWAGAEGPGLSWFGENDKGYLTEKNRSNRPIQELVREGDRLILRVYFINHESTVKEPTSLVFGLQATPAKPMPEGWRTIDSYGMSGPVVPWGGLTCSCKLPYKDDWSVVEKILEGRKTRKADEEWFRQWAEKNDPPMVHGKGSWLEYVLGFAKRAANGEGKPLPVYFEEMRASRLRPEWATFAGEWGVEPYPDRQVVPMEVMRRGFDTQPNSAVTYPDSYIDYALSCADEWLKRGVSLYWDNTYPYASYDTRTTAAYRTEDGEVQPATVIWQQRKYMQRIWNRLIHWQDAQDQPLQWSNHTTNTLISPLHTYGTTFLDLEWAGNDPFAPEFLRTETIGRQVGCIPYSHYPVYGRTNPRVAELPKEQANRINWGMEAVHEIRVSDDLPGAPRTAAGKPVRPAFGYGGAGVAVHNDWEREPVAEASGEAVRWILFHRPEARAAMVILQSYATEGTTTTLRLRKSLGVTGPLRDAETGEAIPVSADGAAEITLPGLYGTRVVTLGDWEEYRGEIPSSGVIRWEASK